MPRPPASVLRGCKAGTTFTAYSQSSIWRRKIRNGTRVDWPHENLCDDILQWHNVTFSSAWFSWEKWECSPPLCAHSFTKVIRSEFSRCANAVARREWFRCRTGVWTSGRKRTSAARNESRRSRRASPQSGQPGDSVDRSSEATGVSLPDGRGGTSTLWRGFSGVPATLG